MTDIMKLADIYARLNAQTTAPGAGDARAALQSAIEALQAENEGLKDSFNSVLELLKEKDAAPKALEPLTDRFAEAYWKACDSSQPLDWMEAALAAQQILQTNRPEKKGTP